MIRALYLLPIVAVLTACSSSSSKPDRPQSPPEYRAMAAYLTGVNPTAEAPVDPNAPVPRIKLNPSPGKAPITGEKPKEVLTSDLKSGAYIAFTGDVPVTQYFKILGSADCDNWVDLKLVSPKMVASGGKYYVDGSFRGGEPTWRCLELFHRKWKDGDDERLSGSDGAIFNALSAYFLETEGLTISSKKVHMDGWAIKFAEPTHAEIEARLSQKAVKPIDVTQLRTVLYWIEQHKASQYSGLLQKLLPFDSKLNTLNGWNEAELAVLHTLAVVDPLGPDRELWLSIMDASIGGFLYNDPKFAIAGLNVAHAPFIAANVLACRNEPGTVDRLVKVADQGMVTQHKFAAAKALVAMGQKDRLLAIADSGNLGSIENNVRKMLADSDYTEPYQCPYRNKSKWQY